MRTYARATCGSATASSWLHTATSSSSSSSGPLRPPENTPTSTSVSARRETRYFSRHGVVASCVQTPAVDAAKAASARRKHSERHKDVEEHISTGRMHPKCAHPFHTSYEWRSTCVLGSTHIFTNVPLTSLCSQDLARNEASCGTLNRAFIHGPSLAFSLARITPCLCRLMSSCHLRLEFSDLVFEHSHLCAAIRRTICFAMHTFVHVALSLPSLLKFPPGAAS
uniref:Uncharacterized protein n=1 Tax=Ixodes ricinus TaxID=34613 RepID=A0A6B0V5S7_IXORI